MPFTYRADGASTPSNTVSYCALADDLYESAAKSKPSFSSSNEENSSACPRRTQSGVFFRPSKETIGHTEYARTRDHVWVCEVFGTTWTR
jgi:hypothetical protein